MSKLNAIILWEDTQNQFRNSQVMICCPSFWQNISSIWYQNWNFKTRRLWWTLFLM